MSTRNSLKYFEQIYNKTYNNTLKYVICRCNNLNDVDDIIQETYLEFYRALKGEKEISNEQSYIIAIAKTKITKRFRINDNSTTLTKFQETSYDEFNFDLDARH